VIVLPCQEAEVFGRVLESLVVQQRDGSTVRPRLSLHSSPSSVSVAVELDQALVADPEVVRDFMEHNPPHFAAKCLRVVSVES
jgi:hypothetical protein